MCMHVELGVVFTKTLRPEETWCIFQASGSRKCLCMYDWAEHVAGKKGYGQILKKLEAKLCNKVFTIQGMKSH